jgi:hypothetical protein
MIADGVGDVMGIDYSGQFIRAGFDLFGDKDRMQHRLLQVRPVAVREAARRGLAGAISGHASVIGRADNKNRSTVWLRSAPFSVCEFL